MTVSQYINTPDFQLCTDYSLHNDIIFECQGDMILSGLNLYALSAIYSGVLTKIPALGIAATEPMDCFTRSFT